jgi:trehalose synthase
VAHQTIRTFIFWGLPRRRQPKLNALQRASTVVIQKSLREGFGLTVAEVLWKKKPDTLSSFASRSGLGEQGHKHVREQFLIMANLKRYLTLFTC